MATLNIQLSSPLGDASAYVQGVWAASMNHSGSVEKPLYSDAGTGIIFNFADNVTIDNDPLPEGVIMLPINRKARSIILSCGAKLAGIRFHPAIGYGVLGQHYEKPTLLLPEQDQAYKLYQVYSELELQENSDAQIDILYRWVDESLDFNTVIPQSLVKTLKRIEQEEVLTGLSEFSELSQRQTERIFKHWLQMTPKYYQRIIRVKKALCFLKRHKRANLADVAQQFGFSDQAHMTREFRFIASVTPAKCRKSLGFNA